MKFKPEIKVVDLTSMLHRVDVKIITGFITFFLVEYTRMKSASQSTMNCGAWVFTLIVFIFLVSTSDEILLSLKRIFFNFIFFC